MYVQAGIMRIYSLWDQRDIKVVTEVFWKLPKCILLSSSLFSFNMKAPSPKYYNPAWIARSIPPVILTLGTAILWKSAPFPLPGSYGKKLSWSYQECASPLPCGCAAFRETGVTKYHRMTGHNVPLEELGKGGDKWISLCCPFASQSWRKVRKTWFGLVFFPALWG